jgi:hypothetical protein
MSTAFVVLAVSTGVVVIVVAVVVALVVLFVTVSMRGRQSVAHSGAVRLGVTQRRPGGERAEGTSARTGSFQGT